MNSHLLYSLALALLFLFSQAIGQKTEKSINEMNNTSDMKLATFGAGCFWCVEAIFQRIEGVEKVVSGYAGGYVKNPTYKEVCQETTGHAEVCQLSYNPNIVSYEFLLEVFWQTHDPTTLNRQGNDIGARYRSAIFYHDQEQKDIAKKYKKKLTDSGIFDGTITTEIVKYKKMYIAEDYHQNYFNENGSQPYCNYVILPKIEKLEKTFKGNLKQ